MKKGNEPAFPRAGSEHTNLADNVRHEPSEGLTKREYFAAMAMQGILASSADRGYVWVADYSIRFADELLRQLEK
jgi:hypothetical protein